MTARACVCVKPSCCDVNFLPFLDTIYFSLGHIVCEPLSLLRLCLTTVAVGTSCYGYILYVVSVQLGAVRKRPYTEINHPECYVLGVKPDETE